MFKNFDGYHLVEAYHKMRHEQRYHPGRVFKKSLEAVFVIIVTLVLWNLPVTAFGIEGLNVVQQRIIAIFAFATLMWVMEVVPSWATSVAVMGLMLLFTSDSGVKWLCDPDEVGPLLSHKGVMACFADPVIMLFIGGFILAIAATKTGLDAQLAKVLLKPFGTKSEKCAAGLPPHYGTVLDVHLEHGYGGHDAHVPHSRVPSVAARGQGSHGIGPFHSRRG